MRNMKTVPYDGMFTLSAPSPKWVWNAQGQLVEAPAGQPAFGYDRFTGEPLGQIIEAVDATNVLLNSFAPATQTVSVSDATTYTLSVYGSGSAEITAGGSGTAMDGSPLTFTTTGTSVTVTVTGTLDVFQLEAGSVATSPIETSGTAVTRAADVVTISGVDGEDWFNQEEFTIVAECVPTRVDGIATFLVLGNSSSRRVLLYFDGGEAIAQLRGTQGIQQATIPASPGERYIFGVSYVRNGESVLSINGSAATYINDIEAGLMDVRFGALLNGTFPNNLWVGDFRVFKHAKTATKLQELTTP
jgi:hypothetical protein